MLRTISNKSVKRAYIYIAKNGEFLNSQISKKTECDAYWHDFTVVGKIKRTIILKPSEPYINKMQSGTIVGIESQKRNRKSEKKNKNETIMYTTYTAMLWKHFFFESYYWNYAANYSFYTKEKLLISNQFISNPKTDLQQACSFKSYAVGFLSFSKFYTDICSFFFLESLFQLTVPFFNIKGKNSSRL